MKDIGELKSKLRKKKCKRKKKLTILSQNTENNYEVVRRDNQLTTRRALTLVKEVPLRTRWALLP